MNKIQRDIFNIETLGRLTGLSRRTIRYYIQRGILQKPYGGGRGHYYTGEHVKRIREIQLLREQGVPIEKMREIFSAPPETGESGIADRSFAELQPCVETHWHRISLGNDIEVSFREGTVSDDEKEKILNCINAILRRKGGENE
jgi:DNA-binding transcriptional MerR regulator